MKVCAIISQKGGCGKSLLATNLAGSLPGLTAILDLDSQNTAVQWAVFRDKNSVTPNVRAVRSTAGELHKFLDMARKHGVENCVIDTSPASDDASLEVAKHADVILIPTLVNIGDVMAVKTTLRLLNGFDVPKFVILNCVKTMFGFPARRKRAVDAILRFGGCVPEVFLPETVKFPDAQAAGKTVIEFAPSSLAADQVRELGKLALASVAA